MWFAAVTQAFFSLNVGFGPLITYSSFNEFRHNVYRDALIISFTDTFTSLLAGFTTFSILGNLAFELHKDVKDVIQSGAGLAFISYPMAIGKFSFFPQIFASKQSYSKLIFQIIMLVVLFSFNIQFCSSACL